ncbi:MAG: hypothetical protein MPJ50_14105 [Pirellulales bacterium]|nr:hypothetical protein [Pirellulales bacterium]
MSPLRWLDLHRLGLRQTGLRRRAIVGMIAITVCAVQPVTAQAGITPESPEVRAAVDRALEFLSTADAAARRPIDQQVGADCLVALALVKGHSDPDGNKNHPHVLKAVALIRQAFNNREFRTGYARIYSTSLAIVFLTALDSKRYQGDISQLLSLLLSFQYPNGGFRDTSMGQYATLALWEAHKAGFQVPAGAWQQVANYWVNGQTVDGQYAYQPGVDESIRSTLSIGGLGCLYICHAVGSQSGRETRRSRQDRGGVAGALTRVGDNEEEKEPRFQSVNLNLGALKQRMDRGDAWYNQQGNGAPTNYKYYFYYGIERYHAFREIERNVFPEEPAWYTEIGNRLLATQADDGSWRGTPDGRNPPLLGTSYAVLFLIRSSKARPRAMGDGRQVGGRGLPDPASSVIDSAGRIRVRPLQGPAEELMKIIADPQNTQYFEALAGLEELVAGSDDAQLSKHLIRFRELAEGGNPQAKAAAITAIARTRSLDDVPFLIYSLNDENIEVARAADDGLRFISRKFGVGLRGDTTRDERTKAISDWKKWYLSIRPDAVFDR